jgi:hypothetical protein
MKIFIIFIFIKNNLYKKFIYLFDYFDDYFDDYIIYK